MSSAVMNLPSGVAVIHVLPAAASPSAALCLGQTVSSVTGQFLKGHPMALGTVQIMIGLMVFLIGLVMSFRIDSLSVYSGIFGWGAIIFITAGSLTVAAASKTTRCLVNGSLGMNVVAAFVAFLGVILYSLDAAGVVLYYFDCDEYRRRTGGVSGVLAVFCLAQFVISICVSAFACKATCRSTPDQVFIFGTHLPQGSTVIPQVLTPPPYQSLQVPKGPEGGAHLNDQPPQYIHS